MTGMQQILAKRSAVRPSPVSSPCSVRPSVARSRHSPALQNGRDEASASIETVNAPNRRDALALLLASQLFVTGTPQAAQAIQGGTAGRIPGLAPTPDEKGLYRYQRPEGKSGGHGVGWSEIPRYGFKIPAGWQEIPVSIADLGGTEIDLRYTSKEMGELSVVVAPVLRFVDVGFNASVRIENIGSPSKVIKGFGPEIFGKPVEDEDILDTQVVSKADLTYYTFDVKPHHLVNVTATRNRVFILSLTASARQWKKHADDLKAIQNSFFVAAA